MTESTDNWTFSADEQGWTDLCRYPTREAAVKAAPAKLSLKPGQVFWTGRRVRPTVEVPSGHALIGWLCDAKAAEEGSESWFEDATEEEAHDLEARVVRAVEDWVAVHPRHRPTWFLVEDSQTHIYGYKRHPPELTGS